MQRAEAKVDIWAKAKQPEAIESVEFSVWVLVGLQHRGAAGGT